jgi:hypothetical protein
VAIAATPQRNLGMNHVYLGVSDCMLAAFSGDKARNEKYT